MQNISAEIQNDRYSCSNNSPDLATFSAKCVTEMNGMMQSHFKIACSFQLDSQAITLQYTQRPSANTDAMSRSTAKITEKPSSEG